MPLFKTMNTTKNNEVSFRKLLRGGCQVEYVEILFDNFLKIIISSNIPKTEY